MEDCPRPAPPLPPNSLGAPSFTLVTVAFNEERSIARTLESALIAAARVGGLWEIIVVAPGCTDRTVQEARHALRNQPCVDIVDGPLRQSKCEGLNVAVARARSHLLVFFDADVVIDPNAIVSVLESFADDASLGVAFGRMVPLAGPSGVWTALGTRTAAALHAIRSLPDGSGRWLVCGPLYAVTRATWKPLPPGLMSDDLYVGLSAATAGIPSRYLPEAIVFGRYPQSLADYLAQKLRNRMARLQLRTLASKELRPPPFWIGGWASWRLGATGIRHAPILVIDGLLSLIALLQWLSGRRPDPLWPQVASTKFPGSM